MAPRKKIWLLRVEVFQPPMVPFFECLESLLIHFEVKYPLQYGIQQCALTFVKPVNGQIKPSGDGIQAVVKTGKGSAVSCFGQIVVEEVDKQFSHVGNVRIRADGWTEEGDSYRGLGQMKFIVLLEPSPHERSFPYDEGMIWISLHFINQLKIGWDENVFVWQLELFI